MTSVYQYFVDIISIYHHYYILKLSSIIYRIFKKRLYKQSMQKNAEPEKPRKKSSSKRKQSPLESSTEKNLLMQKAQRKKQEKQASNNRLTTKVDRYQIDLQSVLGRGTFGQVYKAHLIERPDQVFACKLISKSRLQKQQIYQQNTNGKTMIIRLEQQIQTQKQLSQCKYVVKLFDFVHVPSEGYYLFMEMCDIDLGKLIKQRGFLSQGEALDLFRQLLRGYKYLYDHGISHRDLKPENLLLSGKNLKISDFGFVKVHTATELILRSAQKGLGLAESLVGSINYIAPDILIAEKQKKKYNPFQSDMWSMGIILYKMLYGKEPYQAYQTNQLLQKIETQPLTIPQTPKVTESTKKLLEKIIEKDQSRRSTFRQIFQELIGQQYDTKQENKGPSSVIYSQKERLLLFYNLLMTKISYDCAHHATLREIGVAQYQRYSYRIMSMIHQKRSQTLKSSKDIKPQIKKQILSYEQIFYKAIKQTSETSTTSNSPSSTISRQSTKSLTKTDLATELQTLIDYLRQYNELEMLHKDVQYFILLLILLYNIEKGHVSNDYVFTIIDKQKNNKLNLKKLEELTKKNLEYK